MHLGPMHKNQATIGRTDYLPYFQHSKEKFAKLSVSTLLLLLTMSVITDHVTDRDSLFVSSEL